MAPPRFRGYGFRNYGDWEVRDNCAKAGRNLNIASSAILLYLFSGAHVRGLSFPGATVDVTYPKAFILFGLLGFIWLAYRFLLAYRDAKDTDPWWHLYLRDIVMTKFPATKIVSDKIRNDYSPKGHGHSTWHSKPLVHDFGILHGSFHIDEIRVNNATVANGVEIKLTKRQLAKAHLYCFPRYLISNSDIADMWIPWLLFALATSAMVLEYLGFSPAGLFGLIPK